MKLKELINYVVKSENSQLKEAVANCYISLLVGWLKQLFDSCIYSGCVIIFSGLGLSIASKLICKSAGQMKAKLTSLLTNEEHRKSMNEVMMQFLDEEEFNAKVIQGCSSYCQMNPEQISVKTFKRKQMKGDGTVRSIIKKPNEKGNCTPNRLKLSNNRPKPAKIEPSFCPRFSPAWAL